jgi:ribosome-associated protein
VEALTQDRVERARCFAEAALDKKAEDLVALDVRAVASFADTFIVATGSSDRHVRTIAEAIVERARELGEKPLGVEGVEDGRWVLIDLGDVIVHVFVREVREHYDLERLWSDAAALDVGAAAAGGAAP